MITGNYFWQRRRSSNAGKKSVYIAAGLFVLLTAGIFAQGFGFGDDNESVSFNSGLPGNSVKISGEARAELKGFFDDFPSAETMQIGNIFSGKLNFSASGSSADAVINLKLSPVFNSAASPFSIDEAYARVFLGPVNIEGGLRKLSWGRADSFGPLDVINPLDYSDLSALENPQNIKIARPLLHLTWNLNYFTKLEAVFVPWFEGHSFAGQGRWTPGQITSMPDLVTDYVAAMYYINTGGLLSLSDLQKSGIRNQMNEWIYSGAIKGFYPDTSALNYAQGGLRFSTSLGSSDLGFQYYFGRLPRPAVTFSAGPGFFSPPPYDHVETSEINININYNPYHHIGVDYAQVIAGFNIRAEAGANITSDLDGTDGTVYNPALLWSLGFDRNLFAGISLNAQGSGSIRLFNDKTGSSSMLDTEAGKDMTSTRITLVLSKKFFMDELEIKATGLWGIEDGDFLIMPGIYWNRDSVFAELSAGFFGGWKKGELGQYSDNSYIKILLGCKF